LKKLLFALLIVTTLTNSNYESNNLELNLNKIIGNKIITYDLPHEI